MVEQEEYAHHAPRAKTNTDYSSDHTIHAMRQRIDHHTRLSPGQNASKYSNITRQAYIIAGVSQKARTEYHPASWDRQFASNQLASSNATATNTIFFAEWASLHEAHHGKIAAHLYQAHFGTLLTALTPHDSLATTSSFDYGCQVATT